MMAEKLESAIDIKRKMAKIKKILGKAPALKNNNEIIIETLDRLFVILKGKAENLRKRKRNYKGK